MNEILDLIGGAIVAFWAGAGATLVVIMLVARYNIWRIKRHNEHKFAASIRL